MQAWSRCHRQLLLLSLALSPDLVAQVRVPSDDVAREFLGLCEALKSGPNPYFSESLLEQAGQELENPDADLHRRLATRGLLGRELLKHGRSVEAVAHFRTAWEEAGRLGEEAESLRATIHWHLALAELQRGEDENCVAHRSPASCILPIEGSGVHRQPEASRRARELFLTYAKAHPRNVQAAWLLNLASQTAGADPNGLPPPLRLPPEAFASAPLPRWKDVAVELKVSSVDLAGGAVMDDFDGDGHLDLVASTWDPCGPLKAFRNDGSGGFEDVAEAWGLTAQLGGLNLIQGDYDNDGHLDLLVLRGAWLNDYGRIRNSLLRNELHDRGQFRDVTEKAGLAIPARPTQTAAWSDYDGDGDLDLYIGNESSKRFEHPSQLFRNRGDGTFEDVASAAGVENRRYAKGVAWGDYDDDGDADLYVSNFGPNRLYRNQGDGTFVDVAPALKLTAPERESFATWFFDYDNDGDLDLFVADYRDQPARVSASYFGVEFADGQPLLYRNDGEDGWQEVSRQLGFGRPLMPMGANFGDLDNDGWLDLYLGTGEPDLASVMPNVMYRNDRGRFLDVTFSGGFGHLQKGHGIAFGDLDNDGDQDLFQQLGGFYPADAFGNALFENPTEASSWITLRLEGREANRFGVGARIEVEVAGEEGPRTLYREVSSGGSFGASSLQAEIGLGEGVDEVRAIRLRWPGSGQRQRFGALPARRVYRLVEGEAEAVVVDQPALRLGQRPRGR